MMNKIFSLYALTFVYLVTSSQIAIAGLLVLPPDKYDLEERHTSTKNYTSIEYNKGFNEYLDSAGKIIATENVNSKKSIPEANGKLVLELIRPFEWKSDDFDSCSIEDKTGILLIHGLTDTPFLMRDIGNHFKVKSCFLIRSILLPGHGTKPGDLLEVSDRDWMQATEFGVQSFNESVARLYIAGFSTGGGLALNYMLDPNNLQLSPKINGLLLFSPAIELSVGLAAIAADWHWLYSWAYKPGKWIDVAPDEDFAKYESFAKNAGDQVFEVTVKRRLLESMLKVPVFIAISGDDATINSKATIEYFNSKLDLEVQDASKLLIYYRSNEKDTETVCNRQNIICRKSDIEERISSYAHTAIPVSSDNFHYGKNANYYNCVHYIKDKVDIEAAKKYASCKRSDAEIEYAEIVDDDANEDKIITHKIYRRLTFNPDFSNMMRLVDEFITKNN